MKMARYEGNGVVHLGWASALPGRCFRLCDNPGDPFQVKSAGHIRKDEVVTCLFCLCLNSPVGNFA